MRRSLTVDIVPKLTSVSADEWTSLFVDHPDSHELVGLIESSGMDGFSFHSVVVRESNRPVLLAPLFETVFELSGMVNGAVKAIVGVASRAVPSLLRPRLLGIGFVEGEWGEVGMVRGLPDEILAQAWHLAGEAIERLRRSLRANLTLCLNFTPDAAAALPSEMFGRFAGIQTYPCGRLELPFRDIDEYLAGLSKNTRKDLRRKARTAESVVIRRATDPAPWLDRIMELYTATVDRADMVLGRHRPSFFEQVCRRVPGAEYVLYLVDGRLSAFNLLVSNERLCVDKYFCMEQRIGRKCGLYFVSWMENVRYCIERGIPHYHAGPGAEATKARLGAKFIPSVTLFRHANPLAQAMLRRLRGLIEYRPEVDLS